MIRVDPPPATEPGQRPVAAVALVDEDRADRAGTGVEVLVGAPRGEVDVPVVERQLDVARGVGEVPADGRARGMAGGRQAFDLERLAGGEVDPGQEDEREVGAVLGDGRLEVRGPDGRLAGAWPDDDEVGDRVEAASGQVRRQGVAVGREERAVGQDPASPAGRTEERGQQEMDVGGQPEHQPDLGGSRPDDPGHRTTQRLVHREPRPLGREPGIDAEARPGVELGLDGGADAPRLQPERLAGEVDRPGCRRARREQEAVAERGQRIGAVARERIGLAGGRIGLGVVAGHLAPPLLRDRAGRG